MRASVCLCMPVYAPPSPCLFAYVCALCVCLCVHALYDCVHVLCMCSACLNAYVCTMCLHACLLELGIGTKLLSGMTAEVMNISKQLCWDIGKMAAVCMAAWD